MTDNQLHMFEVLSQILFCGFVLGIPCVLFGLIKKCSRIPKAVYWIGAPVLVWLSLMIHQSVIAQPIACEYARRAGDEIYDGTGAGAAMLVIGLPVGFLSTAIVYGLGTAWCRILHRMKRHAEPPPARD